MHLFCGEVAGAQDSGATSSIAVETPIQGPSQAPARTAPAAAEARDNRIDELEMRVAELEQAVAALSERLARHG